MCMIYTSKGFIAELMNDTHADMLTPMQFTHTLHTLTRNVRARLSSPTQTRTDMCSHNAARIRTHRHIKTCTHIYTHKLTHIRTHTRSHMHAHTHTLTHAHTHAHAHSHARVDELQPSGWGAVGALGGNADESMDGSDFGDDDWGDSPTAGAPAQKK